MITRLMLVAFITFSFSSFSYADDADSARNLKKYKSYAAPKQKRLKDKWSKFKERTNWDSLSDKEKRKLKKKVYDKSH